MSSVSDGEGARLTERPSLLSIRLPSHCAVCTNTNTIKNTNTLKNAQ